MGEGPTYQFLMALASQSPVIIVYAIGIMLALAGFSRNPQPCMLALVGLGVLLLTTFVMTAVQTWLPHVVMNTNGGSRESIRYLFLGMGIVRGLLQAVGILLLIFAVFSGRRTADIPPLVK